MRNGESIWDCYFMNKVGYNLLRERILTDLDHCRGIISPKPLPVTSSARTPRTSQCISSFSCCKCTRGAG